MKKKTKKLVLAKETVRRLEGLASVQGGIGPLSDTLCPSACITCQDEIPTGAQPTCAG